MRRYWLPRESFKENQVEFGGDEFKHICVVCRRAVGDRFEVLNEQNQAFLVELTDVGKKTAVGRILEHRQIPALPKPIIHLALSIPKFQTVDRVVEKSVELGVHSLHLFSSDFSFIKSNKRDTEKKMDRWRKIIKGASQQTGRGTLMTLTPSRPLGVLLEEFSQNPQALGILAYEGEGKQNFENAMRESSENKNEIWIFVGSEGGFSENDLNLFSKFNMIPVSLGDQVLRVETACVTLVSIIKYELGHFD